ncbi:MAG TPA: FapA family protein [Spirochaetota bacterium]|nr:FapA family protein [Spirochaetota bacterium]
MSRVKDLLRSLGDSSSEEEIEVFADSIRQGLDYAARDLGIRVDELDYEVIEKGTKGLFGVGRTPYRILVRPIMSKHEIEEFSQLEKKLSSHAAEMEMSIKEPADMDGSFIIRVIKSGIWLTVKPPKGTGRPVELTDVTAKLYSMRINNADIKIIDKEARKASGSPVRLGSWIPNVEYDSTMRVEVTIDEMKAYVHFMPPRFAGRNMEYDDVMEALKSSGVVAGVNEKRIQDYLEAMVYTQPLVAAEGIPPRNGRDAWIDYKVRINNRVDFSQFDGQIDFKDLNLIENVVVGQLLAVKVPAEKGVQGRTVTNRVLPSRSGRDLQIKHGQGTILSDNGLELTAEKNGQVVMIAARICVEDILVIKGDVDNNTGNITMLGSVVVTGSVLDNFTVKASGNIEVYGTVQKAFLEAEGDIVIRQGVNGRDEAKIETTGGSIYTKMVHSATLIAEKSVVVAEEILHSRVDGGKMVFCNGKRAQIVGGIIRAGEEVNARVIGAESFIKTVLHVGMNPKVLQQFSDLQTLLQKIKDEKAMIDKDVSTLQSRKRTAALPKDQEEKLTTLVSRHEKLDKREGEVTLELEELNAYLGMLEQHGKVCVEKTIFPGVEINIKDQKYRVSDEYTNAKITLEGKDWRFSAYEKPEDEQSAAALKYKKMSRSRR